MAFAAAPFTFWRGDITFRIEVVCSRFNRGKFAIFYEPNISQAGLINTLISPNKQFIKIIDIQETQCVDFCVNWGSYRAWLLLHSPEYAYITDPTDANELIGYNNGYVGIVPFTALQSPNDTSVEMNVYVWSDNMHYNGYAETNMPKFKNVIAQSGRMDDTVSSTPVSCIPLNRSTAQETFISDEHFGEEPISFRSLLKRYVLMQNFTVAAEATSTPKRLSIVGNIYPLDGAPYGSAVAHREIFSYLLGAYVGIRGGMRYRFKTNVNLGYSSLTQAKVSLAEPGTTVAETVTISTGTPAEATPTGTVTFVPNTNGGIEAEFPYYSNNLFELAFALNHRSSDSSDVMCQFRYNRWRFAIDMQTSNSAGTFTTEIATGEDFCLMRFQGSQFYSVT